MIRVHLRAGKVACVAALVLASAVSASSIAATPDARQVAACERLRGLIVPPFEIGLPTSGAVVTAVKPVAASGSGATALPEYCEVTGKISPLDRSAPDIQFKIALPAQWNDKVVMFGGGGFDGTIPNIAGNVPNGPADRPVPLGRGYATFASDSGHQANALGSQDGRFGLNDEALRNFGGDAIKKTHDVALAIIETRYMRGPRKAYFAGGSTGGREALAAIQRWPSDWNGAIAWYPAWDDAAALLGGQRMNRALAKPGAYLSVGKREALYDAAMQACDVLDGVADGLISDQQRCNARFDPSTATLNGAPLRCPKGGDTGDRCLSDAQIEALNTMNTSTHFRFQLASGETQYPGYNVWGADLGMTTRSSPVEPVVTFLALGTSQPANPMPSTAPYISVLTDQWIKYSVTRDPSFNSLSLDPEQPGVWANRIGELSSQLDTSTDISAFRQRGGKLLLAHGSVDVLVSTRATEQYYRRLQERFGVRRVESFVRFYEIPGMGHAASSTFNATWDSLTALDQWVERGKAPAGQVTTDTAGVPGRTRPLCDYPKWARYEGGDVNQAGSFQCVE
ncbi:tannase/feruloyl esterase family alpha/beta hydrolase [Trinickia caryophylli]|uniref:Feruloyl esterase n=1 Tax=Trinickia caryophylli TaxID=28094 RepID=A0A1X7H667_TRICW|nr:tannase/feruloyl esterase family alpha/beta hydrolase [Trinickia caryophylli]PMS13323.1 tannase/feruloyl esterase family alpha/beta hydrolase [Trinickia caryophylli]TRX19149.1 tannase/feruloyl esterase family alpha/beta hydrolase [Trinickia caryophylli]WQE13553.1 tannase/feruloyl esterase family alpha/beta hydrolase [Trinickia caryophylli]SMF80472.1 feruloyl esterase [Trinickia caryophylli]